MKKSISHTRGSNLCLEEKLEGKRQLFAEQKIGNRFGLPTQK